jgi:hypothetical protein
MHSLSIVALATVASIQHVTPCPRERGKNGPRVKKEAPDQLVFVNNSIGRACCAINIFGLLDVETV